MCGRFTHNLTWDQIVALYRLTLERLQRSNLQPNYNFCPTDPIPTVVYRDAEGERACESMRWGLVPGWWSKSLKEAKLATFNARAETVESKPFFRAAWKGKTRCIIPVSGYYEWQDTPTGKQPWYFTARDGSPILSIAGLWEVWTDKENGKPLKSCTMIITEPNKLVAVVHDRMPVLLEPDQFAPWLNGEAGKEILRPAREDLLQRWPVSKRINSSRTPGDDPTLVERVHI